MTDLIQTQQIPTNNGKTIAIISLNNPKTLNAINPEMVQAMQHQLTKWRDDDAVAMLVINSTNDKSFCAGGDIKSIYHHADNAHDFFTHEYALMHTLHTYPKPVLAWGHGIIMGGGMGIFLACTHKIATQNTLMAMPEVSIGLYPDAGASYFLNHLAGKVGLFLGLTGARFNGTDAYGLGLVDFVICHDKFDELLTALQQINFKDNIQNHHLLSAFLNNFHDQSILPNGQIQAVFDEINTLMNGDLIQIHHALLDYQGNSDFIKSALEFYKHGSDLSKVITFKIYHDLKTTKKDFSLKKIFDMETIISTQCVHHGDFKEGVRALLIDKDKNPKWRYTLDEISKDNIDELFGEFK